MRAPITGLDAVEVERALAVTAYGGFLVAQQAARALAGLGGGRFVVGNRTLEHAEAIAREIPQAQAEGVDALQRRLRDSHVVVLAAEGVPLGLSEVEAALHKRRDPLLVVDLSVPRAADPLLASLPGVFLYDVEDLEGTVKEMMRATAEGVDPETMKLLRPTHTAGNADIFVAHFLSGWSSRDHDGDPHPQNCAVEHQNVTQHYAQCWEYNLGADADEPFDDGGWGPHLATHIAERAGLASDGTSHTRVRRISRWTRW